MNNTIASTQHNFTSFYPFSARHPRCYWKPESLIQLLYMVETLCQSTSTCSSTTRCRNQPRKITQTNDKILFCLRAEYIGDFYLHTLYCSKRFIIMLCDKFLFFLLKIGILSSLFA